MSFRLRILLCVGVVPLVGCVSTYFSDRGKDLLDVAGFNVYAGPQMGAHVRLTKMFQMGAATNSGDVYSWDGRRFGVYEENRVEFGPVWPLTFLVGFPYFGVTYYNRAENSLRSGNEDMAIWADRTEAEREQTYDWDRPYDRSFFSIGSKQHFGFLGFSWHIDPMQFSDFLLGWFLIDIARDDAANEGRDPTTGPGPVFPELLDAENANVSYDR